MSNQSISPDKLQKVMADALAKYGDAVYDIVKDTAKAVARQAVSELRQTTPGEIAKTWRQTAHVTRKLSYRVTVYNTNYRLPHLLEYEHVTGPKSGGYYPAHKGSSKDHTGKIRAVEKKYSQKFYNDLVKKL